MLKLRWKRYKLKDDLGNVVRHESISWAWNREKERMIIYVWHTPSLDDIGTWHISIWKKSTHLCSKNVEDCSQEHAEDLALSFIDEYLSDPHV